MTATVESSEIQPAVAVEILVPGLNVVLAQPRTGGAVFPDSVDAFHGRLLFRRLADSPEALRTLRRQGPRLGLPLRAAWASDEELADMVEEALDWGDLVMQDLSADEPEEDSEPDYFPKAMKSEHVLAFQDAAEHFNVFILVRETNLASLEHIGTTYAVPKPLDCKPKTADFDVMLSTGLKSVAGLVVNPEIVGPTAFGTAKYAKAQTEWERFSRTMIKPEVATLEGQKKITYLVGGRYFVDLDPQSERYGALKLTPTGLMSAAKYIHGDFDLYGIVPADDPKRNIRVEEQRLGAKHARSPEFFDVQHFVNRRIGVPMVLHGAEESFGESFGDDAIDIFHPTRRITQIKGANELARLYGTLFEGRKLFTKGGPVDIVRGSYMTPA